ncbi:ABC transporter ATP-binding protein [Candidatus Nitrosotalea okcheonensis]|uniref:Putative oligopeptide transport ATP-binding protein YkfD n=1 Tax=Candidatus Nitrosotalea okcheonensis TaxID=1903276 RepID=A0A2H1FD09_9ARCH|nr:oligopeptide/dipeptide ABC transporter ATP-binding protein [Candidatus Nitrosotalea okcheonensis]MDE1831042.1 ABC transporter ATP-binding protein [Nitrososphaerota archaeon]SMH70656.1 putative oligopeptide transport ATP-binding protein YkfD [Candidatus Nitrosotalea okcheonensis]
MEEILSVKDLAKYFTKKGFTGTDKETIRVADGISFSIKNAETFVLAGESGSGKTTIARIILGALKQDSGTITFAGQKITNQADSLKKIRLGCQMVHQDPYASINPRMTVLDIVKESLEIHNVGNKKERNLIALQALSQVKLEPVEDIASKYPHMLSGGQRQRVAIARAIVTNPKLVIADEPVSMLDVSVRIGILELIKELQEKYGIAFLYITHDLSTARYIGHRIAILYRGRIVETGPINEVLFAPRHPYTQALLDSVSEPDPDNLYKDRKIRIIESTEVNSYQGCRFMAKCPYAIEKCKQEPNLEKISDTRQVACFVKIN